MQQSVLVGDDFENRECVKDHFGQWICEGMYVNATADRSHRQGWVTEVIDDTDGFGIIRVKVVRENSVDLDENSVHVTEFEPGTSWCKALVDG